MSYLRDHRKGLVENKAEYDRWKLKSVTVAEAAERLGFTEAKTLMLIHRGGLPAIVLDDCYRVMIADIELVGDHLGAIS